MATLYRLSWHRIEGDWFGHMIRIAWPACSGDRNISESSIDSHRAWWWWGPFTEGNFAITLKKVWLLPICRVVRGSIFVDPSKSNPPNNWPNPTQHTAKWTYGPMTQPNPYPTEPPYIKQQACRKKISLCTSCHHHPNAHRTNANTHSITSINGQRINISDRWCSDASFHKTNLPVDTRHKVTYIHDMYFCTSAISDPWPNPTR